MRGWIAPHPCVTAMAALALSQLDQGRYRPQAMRALDYLYAQQYIDGYWNAYWCEGRLYATCRTVQAMRRSGAPQYRDAIARASTWLAASQLSDGGWSAGNAESGQAFHTALAVQSLCCSALHPAQQTALCCGVHRLLADQLSDGSWPVVPMMLLPSPDIVYPWEYSTWTDSILGPNVMVPDWCRVFTTATVLQALHAANIHSALQFDE